MHTQNVVYRDIKPENILLGIDGHAKIADLGLAKPNMTKGELAYSFCGSPEYMSPEMIMQYLTLNLELVIAIPLTITVQGLFSMNFSPEFLLSTVTNNKKYTIQLSLSKLLSLLRLI